MENFPVFSISSLNSDENSDSLSRLVARVKLGDESAFGEIYSLYFKRIYKFIYYRVGHKETAEDLAEEVFIKAYGKIAGITTDASFEGWLYQISRNRVIDYYREKKLIISLDEIENTLEYETNLIDIVSLNQEQKLILKLLRQLSPEQQLVVRLKFLEDLDNAEIAAVIGKSQGAIRVIQHRAILRLRQLIKNLE